MADGGGDDDDDGVTDEELYRLEQTCVYVLPSCHQIPLTAVERKGSAAVGHCCEQQVKMEGWKAERSGG